MLYPLSYEGGPDQSRPPAVDPRWLVVAQSFARWLRSVGILVRFATSLGYSRDSVERRGRVPRVRREGPDPAWTINDRT